jgi:hypothetical protein
MNMNTEHKQGEVRHETTDISARTVFWGMFSLAVLVAAAMLLLLGVYRYFAAEHARRDPALHPLAAERPALPPEPRLQPIPAQDMEQMRRAEQQRLSTYGWVDRQQGIVRLPVERAMELIEQRGLPARQPREGQHASPPAR